MSFLGNDQFNMVTGPAAGTSTFSAGLNDGFLRVLQDIVSTSPSKDRYTCAGAVQCMHTLAGGSSASRASCRRQHKPGGRLIVGIAVVIDNTSRNAASALHMLADQKVCKL